MLHELLALLSQYKLQVLLNLYFCDIALNSHGELVDSVRNASSFLLFGSNYKIYSVGYEGNLMLRYFGSDLHLCHIPQTGQLVRRSQVLLRARVDAGRDCWQ